MRHLYGSPPKTASHAATKVQDLYTNVFLNQFIDLVCNYPRCFVPQHDKKGIIEGAGKYAVLIIVCIVPRSFLRQNNIVAETKYADMYANKNLLFIQNMKRANAICPDGIEAQNRLGSHIHTMILVHPPIPLILVQINISKPKRDRNLRSLLGFESRD
ncbi:hypothetical protein [Sphingobacterium mizutaii]|uniref:hypothetical protein n=1 Tax=Sphingobacterium mizutaii TaxID=1010 RepID=UPI00162905F6|nr:hypothetical protein [Sphingobacterium mizutaii]